MEHCHENCDVAQNCRSGIIDCFVLITFSKNEPPKTAIETSIRIVPNHNNLPGFNLLFFLLNNDFDMFQNCFV